MADYNESIIMMIEVISHGDRETKEHVGIGTLYFIRFLNYLILRKRWKTVLGMCLRSTQQDICDTTVINMKLL